MNEPNTMSTPALWVCGKVRGINDEEVVWELQGVFDTEGAAVAVCREKNDFVGPVPLNRPLPQHSVVWPGCRYPLAE